MRTAMIWPFAALGLLLLLLVWGANRSVFFPVRYPQGFWELQEVLGAQDVTFRTSDGVRLHAWWLEAPQARVATLFLHGNAGNVTHRFESMRTLASAGSSVLVPDYRGYGKSEGRPTERGLYRDARAAYEAIRLRGWDASRIVLHGESLGSAVAARLATEVDCAGLVLEAPFPSARAVAAKVLPFIGPLLVWGLDTEASLVRFHKPLLVIHGDQDEVIPYELGQRVYAQAREPKQFWTVPGAGHNNLIAKAGPEYPKRLRSFYASLWPR